MYKHERESRVRELCARESLGVSGRRRVIMIRRAGLRGERAGEVYVRAAVAYKKLKKKKNTHTRAREIGRARGHFRRKKKKKTFRI